MTWFWAVLRGKTAVCQRAGEWELPAEPVIRGTRVIDGRERCRDRKNMQPFSHSPRNSPSGKACAGVQNRQRIFFFFYGDQCMVKKVWEYNMHTTCHNLSRVMQKIYNGKYLMDNISSDMKKSWVLHCSNIVRSNFSSAKRINNSRGKAFGWCEKSVGFPCSHSKTLCEHLNCVNCI